MKLLKIMLVMVALMAVNGLSAQQTQRIVLNDNSIIVGEIVEMRDGVYRIKTTAMGEVQVRADQINSMTANNSSQVQILDQEPPASHNPRQPDSANYSHQQEHVNSRVRSMAMNEDYLENLMDLSGSSEMLSVMSDPEVMDAISRNDYEFLMNNEKMKNLMDSQGIRSLLGEMDY